MPQRPYAVFDIDGTLIRWQLYHALADKLVKLGAIDAKAYQQVLTARRNWKSRRSSNSFSDYEAAMTRLVHHSLPGMEYDLFSKACSDVFSRYQDQVYTYTRDLITELRQQHYLIFALSGSPEELVSMVASYYNFDDFGGSVYSVKEGYLSGRVKLMLRDNKPKTLASLIKKHAATSSGSMAVGDTTTDIGMLEMAERAIAFNPSKDLFDYATKSGWRVVVERKNMVYLLNYKNGNYILSPADDRQTVIL
ncbi:MAG: HAD family hydrolase [Candidatus Saccharimonadales bacterium]